MIGKTFPDELKRLRTRDGLSQAELARKIRVSRSTISMYESGQREPDFETIEALADSFNVPISTLMGEKKNVAEHGDDMDDILQTLRERPDMRILFKTSKKATPEAVMKMAELLKAFNNEDTD